MAATGMNVGARGGPGHSGGRGDNGGSEAVVIPGQWQNAGRRMNGRGGGEQGSGGGRTESRTSQQLPWMEDSQRIQDMFQAAADAAASVVSIPTNTRNNASAVSIPTVAGTTSRANINARGIAAPLDSDSEYEPQTLDDRSIGEQLQGSHARSSNRLLASQSELASIDTVRIDRGSEAVSNYNTADVFTDDGSDDQDNSIATLQGNGVVYVSLAPMSRAHTNHDASRPNAPPAVPVAAPRGAPPGAAGAVRGKTSASHGTHGGRANDDGSWINTPARPGRRAPQNTPWRGGADVTESPPVSQPSLVTQDLSTVSVGDSESTVGSVLRLAGRGLVSAHLRGAFASAAPALHRNLRGAFTAQSGHVADQGQQDAHPRVSASGAGDAQAGAARATPEAQTSSQAGGEAKSRADERVQGVTASWETLAGVSHEHSQTTPKP